MLLQILTNMGFRYVGYRVLHLIRTKFGWYEIISPKIVKPIVFLDYAQWLENKKEYFFDNAVAIEMDVLLSEDEKRKVSETASKIKKGMFLFFNSEEFSLGNNYNWVTNPLNGYVYPSNLHWSKINDYDSKSGDIKFVWEKSRFSFLYDLIRDEKINGNEHRDFVLLQISDWIDANSVNQGPNWKCSQEISIRVLNWIFALYYYSDKGHMNEELWQKILNSIFQQMLHVQKHINFSRIAVRNNHAITETLTLYIVGLLFPWLDKTGEWKKKGKQWFEQEVE
ncbi:MAG: heparinase II/III family protein, partial [Leadbetterella sp.]|nr:heparinase II/III family protein [Leadbetterella sp.]